MSGILRICLIVASVLTCVFIQRKLKKAQVRGYDTIFWLLFSGVLILISIFPEIADWTARLVGVYSSENVVFLIIIFSLLIRVFLMTLKISRLENSVVNLVEELAIRDKMAQAETKERITPIPY